jgi:hypothetical protein
MNTRIVNETFLFVKWLYGRFLPPGYGDFQLERSMATKNTSVLIGRKAQLDDDELEIMALAALLYNVGCIEGQYENRAVSITIARSFLEEQGLRSSSIAKVIACIAATAPDTKARSKMEELMKFVQDASRGTRFRNSGYFRRPELPDVFP